MSYRLNSKSFWRKNLHNILLFLFYLLSIKFFVESLADLCGTNCFINLLRRLHLYCSKLYILFLRNKTFKTHILVGEYGKLYENFYIQTHEIINLEFYATMEYYPSWSRKTKLHRRTIDSKYVMDKSNIHLLWPCGTFLPRLMCVRKIHTPFKAPLSTVSFSLKR